MLGTNTIRITPPLLRQICDIDEFKGLWRGLDNHTTGLHMLGDVVDYGESFKQILVPLQENAAEYGGCNNRVQSVLIQSHIQPI